MSLFTCKLRQTTASRDFRDNILNSMTESLVVTSPQGIIQSANNATQQLLGYTQEELIGQDIQILLSGDDTDEPGDRRSLYFFPARLSTTREKRGRALSALQLMSVSYGRLRKNCLSQMRSSR